MKRFFLFVLLLACVITAGCAQKVLTPQEIEAERNRQIQMITRYYPDKTAQEVLLAADRVFRLADDDYTVSHSPTGLQAQRKWMLFLLISVSTGTDAWTVTTEPLPEGGVKVMAMHSSSSASTSVLMTPTTTGGASASALTTPAIQNMTTKPAIYELFFARLEHLLGKRKDWPTCKEAKKLFTDGLLEPFCMVANDRTPDGLSASQRRAKEEQAHTESGVQLIQ